MNRIIKFIIVFLLIYLTFNILGELFLKNIYIINHGLTESEFYNYAPINNYLTTIRVISIIFASIIGRKVSLLTVNANSFYKDIALNKSFVITEYFRFWKLMGLCLTICFLIIGSIIFKLPDWDIPISIIMALLTYILSPISLWLLLNLKNQTLLTKIIKTIISSCFCWLTVDFIYCSYNNYFYHHYYRESNFIVSFVLYWISSLFLGYSGDFKSLCKDIQKIKFISNKNLIREEK